MSEDCPVVPVIPLHRLRVYNPARMNDDEITVLFAVREELLQRILSDVSHELNDSRPQHHLLVGQRGMGKSTLLLRLAAAFRSPPLRDRFIPLSFAEEQYTIDRLSQFWLNCLDSLADSCERDGSEVQARTIDQIVSDITAGQPSSPRDDAAASRAALDAFRDAVRLTGRRPVLLIDNLQLIFERTAEQQREFRAALTAPSAPILVAAAPQLPLQMNEYGFPLYDHFKIHQLGALSLQDMQRLLLRLADRTDKPAIRRHVQDHPGRIQALHQLTGGNPRTTVLLFHLYAEDCSPSVAEDLEKLLDDVTALYKGRFEELSDQQQVIVSRLAEHWDPTDSRTLAAITRLEPGQISSQLDRLLKAGVVEEVELFGTKRSGYQLAERFFNIWFLMRHASRRLRQPLRFLTKFLETLYETGERENIARMWSNSRGLSSGSLLFSRALADSISASPARGDLIRNTELEALLRHRENASRRVEELLELDKVTPAVLEFAELHRRLTEEYGAAACRQILGSLRQFVRRRRGQLAAVHRPSAEQIEAVLQEVSAAERSLVVEFGQRAVEWLSERLVRGQLCQRDSADDWERTMAAAVSEGESAVRLVVDHLPDRLVGQIQPQFLEQAASVLAADQAQTAIGWYNSAWRLHVKLQRYAEAESAYRRSIELDGAWAMPWNGLGNLLSDHLQRYAEAESAYRRSIELDGTCPWPWNGLGNLYCDFLGRFPEAAEAYSRALSLDAKNACVWYNLVFLQRDFLGDPAAARQSFAVIESEFSAEFVDTRELHRGLFAAYEQNLGLAAGHFDAALDLVPSGLPSTTACDWCRTAAVLLELGHGEWFQQVLQRRGHNHSLRPFFEAIRAQTIGERAALLNVAPEVRPAAGWLYDQIEQRRQRLQNVHRRQESSQSRGRPGRSRSKS
ncbi:MAG: AAA family ATPase [Planctomyces sp.]